MPLTPAQCAIVRGLPAFPAEWGENRFRMQRMGVGYLSTAAKFRSKYATACETGADPLYDPSDRNEDIKTIDWLALQFGLPRAASGTASQWPDGREALAALRRRRADPGTGQTNAEERVIIEEARQLGAFAPIMQHEEAEQTAAETAAVDVEASNAAARMSGGRAHLNTRLDRERRIRERADRERRERNQERTEPMAARLMKATPGGGHGGQPVGYGWQRAPVGGPATPVLSQLHAPRPRHPGYMDVGPGGRPQALSLGGIGDWFRGAISGGPKKWTKLPANASYEQLSAAAAAQSGIPAGSTFALFRPLYKGARWGVVRGNDVDVDIERGRDINILDLVGFEIVKRLVAAGTTAMVPTRGGGELCGLPAGMAGCGREPMITSRRTCGRGWILAVDGMCYPKKMLSRGMRMNDSRKAPVTHSDLKAITRAARTQRRLETLDKRVQRLSKPRRRRTR